MTGLNPPLADILFSISPNSLPDALAKAQELEANKLRANFALHFNKPHGDGYPKGRNFLRFPNRAQKDFRSNPFNNQHLGQKSEPMDVGSSNNVFVKPPPNFNNNTNKNFSQGRPLSIRIPHASNQDLFIIVFKMDRNDN